MRFKDEEFRLLANLNWLSSVLDASHGARHLVPHA
jgi:hypothetical protein